MAEETYKKLEEKVEEQLKCSICLDTYTEPKLLQCFHVYCQKCLVPLVDRDEQEKLKLTCPTCRKVTPVPERGVAGLQSAFQINRLLEIQGLINQLRNPAATQEGTIRGASINTPSSDVYCFEHVEEELKLYCGTCEELVCLQCVLKDGKHHDHDCLSLNKAFERYKEEITSFVEPLEEQVATIQQALGLLNRRREDISYQQAVVEDNVHNTFRRLREVLDSRETELTNKLHQTSQGKLKDLAAQSEEIETTLSHINSCLCFIKESLITGNKQDVMMMKMVIVSQASELTMCIPFKPGFLKPNTEADMAFSASADLDVSCQNYGDIFVRGQIKINAAMLKWKVSHS